MGAVLNVLVSTLRSATSSRVDLLVENAALREQIEVYRRQVRRPRLRRSDRVFWIWLRRHWPRWKQALRHFIFLSEDHLRKTVGEFVSYYNEARPNQGIDGIPACGPGAGPMLSEVSTEGPHRLVARPVLGGLHHDYRLAA